MSYKPKQFETEHPAPHGWIQWKGTDVCIDIHCECGSHLHYDGDFMYFVRCPKCKAVFECDGHIKLHRVPDDEVTSVIAESCEIREPRLGHDEDDDA